MSALGRAVRCAAVAVILLLPMQASADGSSAPSWVNPLSADITDAECMGEYWWVESEEEQPIPGLLVLVGMVAMVAETVAEPYLEPPEDLDNPLLMWSYSCQWKGVREVTAGGGDLPLPRTVRLQELDQASQEWVDLAECSVWPGVGDESCTADATVEGNGEGSPIEGTGNLPYAGEVCFVGIFRGIIAYDEPVLNEIDSPETNGNGGDSKCAPETICWTQREAEAIALEVISQNLMQPTSLSDCDSLQIV